MSDIEWIVIAHFHSGPLNSFLFSICSGIRTGLFERTLHLHITYRRPEILLHRLMFLFLHPYSSFLGALSLIACRRSQTRALTMSPIRRIVNSATLRGNTVSAQLQMFVEVTTERNKGSGEN